MKLLTFASALCLALAAPSCVQAQATRPAAPARPVARQVEKLGRGVVAIVPARGKVFVSWRLLPSDAPDVAFDVYRGVGNGAPKKLNARPLSGATNFVDEAPPLGQSCKYLVGPVSYGAVFRPRPAMAAGSFMLLANAEARPYLSIPLRTPEGYAPNDASVGALDGDGEYEIVLHLAGRGRDNSQDGETDPPILQAYKLDGTFLWSINLGRNIREGAHYTQFMVFDLDGDGRAEIVCKTADGTTDGAGAVIGDAKADWRDPSGRILRGPEFLSVFDGLSGKVLATEKYVPGRHPETENPTGDQLKAVWGDGYGNRGDRFLAAVAYLDGVHPSVVMCRGYYTRTVLAAWDWRGGKLSQRWTFDSDAAGNGKYAGQGNHNLSVADVDGDGRDEIIYGKMAVDDNGQGLYSTGIGHGDAMHVSDLDPSRPGLEVFSIQEPVGDAGVNFFDARTGEVLWKRLSIPRSTGKAEGPGRGLALDIDPRTPGAECWAAGAGLGDILWDAKGNVIGDKTPTCNMGVFWDGDPQSEILSGTLVEKWDYVHARSTPLLEAANFDGASNNGTKANPCLSADLLGDWREEIIWRTRDNNELRLFTSSLPTPYRLPTLMSDPEYRLSIAWQNVAYNQPPHLSYDLQSRLQKPASAATVAANIGTK